MRYFKDKIKQHKNKQRTREYYDEYYGNFQQHNSPLYNELVRNNYINLHQDEFHYKSIKPKKITHHPRHEYKTTKTANGNIFKQYAK